MSVYPWQNDLWGKLVSGSWGQPNALLLKGQKGIGKLDFARAWSQFLLCENRLSSFSSCGKCQGCVWFAEGIHPDFRLLEPASYGERTEDFEPGEKAQDGEKKESRYIEVEQIRELDDFVNLSSHRNRYKVILIHPAETMNAHAASAILKTLEEPPERTLFILVSHRPQRLLPTITSRCRSVSMPVPGRKASLEWLAQKSIGEEDIVLAQSGYAPLAALEIAKRGNQEQRKGFLEQLSSDELNPLALAESGRQYPLSDIINWLQKWVCDLAYCKFTGEVRYHLDFAERLLSLSRSVNVVSLMRYYRELQVAQRSVQHPLNTRLVLDQLALSYCRRVPKKET